MRRVLPTLLIVAVFVVASLLWEGHVRQHAQSLISLVEQAMKTVDREEDYKACQSLLEDFSKQWEHVHDSWETLVAHKRLTDIDASLVQAQWAAENEEKEQTLSHLALLKLDLEHLSSYYSLSWSNLF